MTKNLQKISLFAAVFSVMLVAGCVQGSNWSLNIFGTTGNVNEAPADILVVQNDNVIPEPPQVPGDEFTINFEVKNTDEINSVSDVSVWLYDWGLCDDSVVSNDGSWVLSGSSYTKTIGRMVPGQSKPVELILKAPTATQLGNLPGSCPVKYKVSYKFTAATSTSAQVISATRLRELQAAREAPVFTPTTDIGRGPIKIYMEPVSTMPARTNSTLTLAVQVQNKGTGTYINIPQGALKLKVPSAWVLMDDCGGEFNTSIIAPETESVYKVYKNTQPNGIDLVGVDKQTFEIRCAFTTPSESVVQETKDYFLFANLTYNYDIIKEMDVEVKP